MPLLHRFSVSVVQSGFADVSERDELVIGIGVQEEVSFFVEPVHPERNDAEGLVERRLGTEGFFLGSPQGNEYAVRFRGVVFFEYPLGELGFEEGIGNVLYDFFHPFLVAEENDPFRRGGFRKVFYPESGIFFEGEEIRLREERTFEDVFFEFRGNVVGNRKRFRKFHRFDEGSKIERLLVGRQILGLEFLFADFERFRICRDRFRFREGHDFRSRFGEYLLAPFHASAPTVFREDRIASGYFRDFFEPVPFAIAFRALEIFPRFVDGDEGEAVAFGARIFRNAAVRDVFRNGREKLVRAHGRTRELAYRGAAREVRERRIYAGFACANLGTFFSEFRKGRGLGYFFPGRGFPGFFRPQYGFAVRRLGSPGDGASRKHYGERRYDGEFYEVHGSVLFGYSAFESSELSPGFKLGALAMRARVRMIPPLFKFFKNADIRSFSFQGGSFFRCRAVAGDRFRFQA